MSHEEKTALIHETNKWLEKLHLYVLSKNLDPKSEIRKSLKNLSPGYLVDALLESILQFAETDEALHPERAGESEPTAKKETRKRRRWFFKNDRQSPQDLPKAELVEATKPALREATVYIESDYRRKKLVEGVELPSSHTFEYDILDLSTTIREKIVAVFYNTSRNPSFPARIDLRTRDENGKNVTWWASLDPFTTPKEDIFKAWAEAYDKSPKKGQSEESDEE